MRLKVRVGASTDLNIGTCVGSDVGAKMGVIRVPLVEEDPSDKKTS